MSALAAAAPFVGVPYLPKGLTPEGWDCWGCFSWCRAAIFGAACPSWAGDYDLADFAEGRLVEVAASLILQNLAAWTRHETPAPGRGVLIRVFGRPAHVGLMLDRRHFIHAWEGTGTVIETIDSRWSRRIEGFYEA